MTENLFRTRIKICGMTEPDEVRAAVALGVDAIGMILHANSPRLIDRDRAKQIRAEVPAFVSLVGVFVNCDTQRISDMARDIDLDLIQLHGDESNEFGIDLPRPFIKAIRARNSEQVASDLNAYPDARAVLLDPYVKNQHGGTGKQLDEALWPTRSRKKLILAGGLNPDNVAALTLRLKPFAVDMNSGLEQTPGRKDLGLMRAAVNAVRASDV